MSRVIRILVVSPSRDTHEGLTKLLNMEDDFEVVGSAETGLEALQKAGETQPDIVLTGMWSTDISSLEFIRRLKQQIPSIGVVIVSLADQPQTIQKAYKAGADAYIVKPFAQDEVETAVRQTYAQLKAEKEGVGEKQAIVAPAVPSERPQLPKIFVSYSRSDWDEYVEPLVMNVRDSGFDVWVDQHLLHGGDYWFDRINEALQSSNALILCVSPQALESKFVKMEYRYFFMRDKPIIPVMCRPVDNLPAELSMIQYIDYDLGSLVEHLKEL
jgi:CheY-like chemotaxis protein